MLTSPTPHIERIPRSRRCFRTMRRIHDAVGVDRIDFETGYLEAGRLNSAAAGAWWVSTRKD